MSMEKEIDRIECQLDKLREVMAELPPDKELWWRKMWKATMVIGFACDALEREIKKPWYRKLLDAIWN